MLKRLIQTVKGGCVSRLGAAVLLCLGAAFATPAAGQVVVDAKLDRAEIRIGERATLGTTVTLGADLEAVFPDYRKADTLTAGVEVVSVGDVDTVRLDGGKRLQLRRDYIITSFDSALYALPPFTVTVGGRAYSSHSRLGLKVETVPVDTTDFNRFEPAFDVAESPFAWRNRLLVLSLLSWLPLAVVVVAAVRLSSRRPVRRRVVIKPPVPPYKKASLLMGELQPEVAQADTPDAGKAFFIRLTDIVRMYLDERYGFNAMERTTADILDGLRDVVDATALRRLGEVFGTADAVKFAKHIATDMERKRCFDVTADFLLDSRDEAMELPRPEVRVVTYSDSRQHKFRVALWVALGLSAAAATGLFAWALSDVAATYF